MNEKYNIKHTQKNRTLAEISEQMIQDRAKGLISRKLTKKEMQWLIDDFWYSDKVCDRMHDAIDAAIEYALE